MLKSLRLFAFVATLSLATSVASSPSTADPDSVVLYVNPFDYKSSEIVTKYLTPPLYQRCGEFLDFDVVYAGNSTEPSPGKFECAGGEENCKWLENMNCLLHMYQQTRLSILLALNGRVSVESLYENLDEQDMKELKQCLDSGLGAKLLSRAITTTQERIRWLPETMNVGLERAGEQDEEPWELSATNNQTIWDKFCGMTGAPACCVFSADPWASSNIPSEAQASSRSLRSPVLRGASNVAASEVETEDVAPVMVDSKADIEQEDTFAMVPPPPGANKTKMSVYLSGNDVMEATTSIAEIAGIAFTPCGATLEWEFEFAGVTNETSPDNFECFSLDKRGDRTCKWLEAMNCVKDVYESSSDADHESTIVKASDYQRARQYILHSILGRQDVGTLESVVDKKLQPAVRKCVDSGKGRKLLHGAVQRSKKAIKWDQVGDIPIGIAFDDEPYYQPWKKDLWKGLCEHTRDATCCVYRNFTSAFHPIPPVETHINIRSYAGFSRAQEEEDVRAEE